VQKLECKDKRKKIKHKPDQGKYDQTNKKMLKIPAFTTSSSIEPAYFYINTKL